MMPTRRRFACLAALSLSGGEAIACPVCRSEAGEQVRAGILGADFLPNLFAIFAPFPVLAAIVALLFYGLPRRNRGKDKSP